MVLKYIEIRGVHFLKIELRSIHRLHLYTLKNKYHHLTPYIIFILAPEFNIVHFDLSAFSTLMVK